MLFSLPACRAPRSIVNPAVAPLSTDAQPTAAAGDSYIEKNTPAFKRTVLALFAGGFATFALLYCVQPMMPLLSQEFSINAAQSSLILSVATAMLAIGLLITGPISDRLGRKPVMVLALFCAALSTIASALMPSWEGVLVTRALVGLSLSGLAAVAMTYLSEEIHPMHLGLAMGLYIGGSAVGGMSGRLITGVMIDYVSWHTAMLVVGGLALIAAAVFWKILPESRNFQPRSLHPRSLLDGFVLQFRDAGLPLLFLLAFLLMGAFVTLFNYIGYRLLTEPYNLSQAVVGVFSIVYLSGIYSSAQIGALGDRLGRRKVLWAVIVMMLIGLAMTLFTPLLVVIVGVLIFTFGFFGAHSLASSWVGRRAVKARGQATSLYLFCYYAGSSVAGTGGGVFWHYAGWNGIGLFVGALLLIALAVALRLSKLQPLGAKV
ncbi:MFS transporter [Pseudomonas cichorii]|nr:MFS transporter [Pseudomonas cichorii]MBX8565233.1 MFS transporter [Pseudomonas cichorii]